MFMSGRGTGGYHNKQHCDGDGDEDEDEDEYREKIHILTTVITGINVCVPLLRCGFLYMNSNINKPHICCDVFIETWMWYRYMLR